jgi:hypothetical protein
MLPAEPSLRARTFLKRRNCRKPLIQNGKLLVAEVFVDLFDRSPIIMKTTALRDRLMDGLDRFASAMRTEVRRTVASRGLNPAQDAILRMLLARATIVKVTPEALTKPAAAVPSLAAAALADLSEAEQVRLLKTLIKLIRSLQLRHAIPPQRLCVSCKYFRPNVHPEAEAPHHCAFVDAPFGDGALRLDCAEHEQASAPEIAQNWDAFMTRTNSTRSGHDV